VLCHAIKKIAPQFRGGSKLQVNEVAVVLHRFQQEADPLRFCPFKEAPFPLGPIGKEQRPLKPLDKGQDFGAGEGVKPDFRDVGSPPEALDGLFSKWPLRL
jgi:hypothetical protein